MFVLLPLFAGLLKGTFRRRFYIEHLIFALHAPAFVFLLLTLAVLLPFLGGWPTLAGAIYLLAALRVVYKQSWGWILLKGFLLFNIYVILLALASAAVIFLAFWHL